MLVNDAAAEARLKSPMNLINRMTAARSNPRQSAMNLFGMGKKTASPIKEEVKEVKEDKIEKIINPFEKSASPLQLVETINPSVTELIEDSEAQMKLALAHNTALELLNNSVAALAAKLDDVKADKLPGVITAASKVVDNIRRERNDAAKAGKDKEVHYHFYTPQQRKLAEYEIIEVAGTVEHGSAG